MENIFRQKFTQYLTQGIPVHIDDDEVFLFYEALDNFVNGAPNKYNSFYEKGDNYVVVSEGKSDRLKVLYANNLIQFRHPDLNGSTAKLSGEEIKKMAEAFVGVLLFIESLNPTNDSKVIGKRYYDQWYN